MGSKEWPRNQFYTEEEKVENYRRLIRQGGVPVIPLEAYVPNNRVSFEYLSLWSVAAVARCRECLGYDYDNEHTCLASIYDRSRREEKHQYEDGEKVFEISSDVVDLCPSELVDLMPFLDWDYQDSEAKERMDSSFTLRFPVCEVCRKITALSKYHGLDAKAFLAEARNRYKAPKEYEEKYAEALPKIKALIAKYREGLDNEEKE